MHQHQSEAICDNFQRTDLDPDLDTVLVAVGGGGLAGGVAAALDGGARLVKPDLNKFKPL